MRRYLTVAAGVLAFFLTVYLLVDAAAVAALDAPDSTLHDAGAWAAPLAVGLLVADAFVPVASSLVMLSLGTIYGPAGAIALALLGRLGMWLVGFAAGRKAGPLLGRTVPERERARAERLLTRHGALAVVVSRPAPLLAETVAVLAGASRMSWSKGVFAALVGSIPEAVTYALAGGVARSFQDGAFIWVLFLSVAAGFWIAAALLERRRGMPSFGS